MSYVVADGKSNWLDGAILISLYVIIAVSFWYYPGILIELMWPILVDKPFYQVSRVILLPAQSVSQQIVEAHTHTKLPPTIFMDTFARTLRTVYSNPLSFTTLDR